MKKLVFPVYIFWFLILPAAFAQQNGVLEGRIVDRTDPAIIASNVELEVIELSSGMSIIRVAATDSAGRFRIDKLPENQPLLIRANYKGANYHSQVSFNKEGKANVDIDVFEPTTSMKDMRVVETQIAFRRAGDHLESVETVTIDNKTDPPRTFASPEGSFRFSKPPGILEPPQITVAAGGMSMPVVQTALESPDGKSYYSLYPLRPGTTRFEIHQLLPYTNGSYTYEKKFYWDSGPLNIGVIPSDMALSGQNLRKTQTDSQQNFSVYASSPIKAGAEVVWTLSGGTPVSETAASQGAGGSTLEIMPGYVGRNTLIIGPILLMGLILVLWYEFNHPEGGMQSGRSNHIRQLKERREQLLNAVADLDHRYEANSIGRQEFLGQREEHKRQLYKISLLLKKK